MKLTLSELQYQQNANCCCLVRKIGYQYLVSITRSVSMKYVRKEVNDKRFQQLSENNLSQGCNHFLKPLRYLHFFFFLRQFTIANFSRGPAIGCICVYLIIFSLGINPCVFGYKCVCIINLGCVGVTALCLRQVCAWEKHVVCPCMNLCACVGVFMSGCLLTRESSRTNSSESVESSRCTHWYSWVHKRIPVFTCAYSYLPL